MPYEKHRKPCIHKDGTKGTFKTRNKETGEWKCWKSEAAFKRAQSARHAANESIDYEALKQIIKEELKASDALKNISFSSTDRSATARLPFGRTTISPTFGLAKRPLRGLSIEHKILPSLMAKFDPIRQKLDLNWEDVWRGWDWKAAVYGRGLQNPTLAWKFALGKRFKDLGNLRLGVEYEGRVGETPGQRATATAGFRFE